MNYPSLLYMENPGDFKLDNTVYDDIKFSAFLEPEIIAAILKPCGNENILARQELFKDLDSPNLRTHFERLQDCTEKMSSLNLSFEKARTENEKFIIYLSLMKTVSDFYKQSAIKNGDSVLYNRFCSFFTNELEKKSFIKMCNDIDEIYPKIESIKKTKFKIHNENLKIISERSETYVNKISECANNLGLPKLFDGKSVSIHLSINIINTIAELYKDEFALFKKFYDEYKPYYSKEILKYQAEIGFFLSMETVFDKVKKSGIPLTYPNITNTRKIKISDAYDITLLTKDEMTIIPNDVNFNDNEPFFYLTGANGGGKTTYLRAVGIAILMYLNGCPIACTNAEIYPIKKVFTHFPRDERFDSSGRFHDEENRVQSILANVDSESLVLLNETYSTANEDAAVELTGSLADKIYRSGAYGIYITHQHGITETEIPYLNVVVDRSDANRRTYKVEKRKSEHGSYALDILKKYNLTKEDLAERFGGSK